MRNTTGNERGCGPGTAQDLLIRRGVPFPLLFRSFGDPLTIFCPYPCGAGEMPIRERLWGLGLPRRRFKPLLSPMKGRAVPRFWGDDGVLGEGVWAVWGLGVDGAETSPPPTASTNCFHQLLPPIPFQPLTNTSPTALASLQARHTPSVSLLGVSVSLHRRTSA